MKHTKTLPFASTGVPTIPLFAKASPLTSWFRELLAVSPRRVVEDDGPLYPSLCTLNLRKSFGRAPRRGGFQPFVLYGV